MVAHVKRNFVIASLQPHMHGQGFGVAMNIRQAFLQDTEQDQFDIARQPSQRLRDIEFDLNAAVRRLP